MIRLSIIASPLHSLLCGCMARRPRLLAPGVLYHVIVRGNQRQKSFFDDSESVLAIGPDRGRDGGAALRGDRQRCEQNESRIEEKKIKDEGGKRKDERSVGKTSCG